MQTCHAAAVDYICRPLVQAAVLRGDPQQCRNQAFTNAYTSWVSCRYHTMFANGTYGTDGIVNFISRRGWRRQGTCSRLYNAAAPITNSYESAIIRKSPAGVEIFSAGTWSLRVLTVILQGCTCTFVARNNQVCYTSTHTIYVGGG